MTKARQKRGMMDTLVVLLPLADRSRFQAPDRNLRNIMTGANTDNAVNVDHVRATGEKMLSSMTGVSNGSE